MDINQNPVFCSKTESSSISLSTGFQIFFAKENTEKLPNV